MHLEGAVVNAKRLLRGVQYIAEMATAVSLRAFSTRRFVSIVPSKQRICCTQFRLNSGIARPEGHALAARGKTGDRKWWDIAAEWKIIASVVVATTSFFLNAKIERNQLKKEMKLKRLQSQIRDLYGPLYGNRLVSETSYRAVMKNHNELNKYLHEARKNRDADMIRRWRAYVWNVLYPLDKSAVELILKNAHLIAHGDFPKEFEQLLVHVAKMEFVMEHWKTDDGRLEPTKEFTDDDYLEVNNASGIARHSLVLEHVKCKYDGLRKELNDVSLEISNDKQADDMLSMLMKKVMRQ